MYLSLSNRYKYYNDTIRLYALKVPDRPLPLDFLMFVSTPLTLIYLQNFFELTK